jgi:penicillin-binding protein 1C
VLLTPERFAQRLGAVGLALKHNGDYYGYSLALGSAEVTLATLTNAYRTLANGGAFTPLRTQPGDPAPKARQVMDAGASFIVSDVLADREARVPTFGLDNALSPRYWAAVKTGTSKDMRDNWCVGYSQRYTVGVWVGNASGEPMWNVSGVTGAAPVWRAVMDGLQRQSTPAIGRAWQPHAPPELVSRLARFDATIEPPRDEWFLPGTEQTVITRATASGRATSLIASPTDRSTIALDPDIPAQAQRLRIAAVAGTPPTWSWRMDGKRIGAATTLQWAPWPGTHRLELVDQAGAVRESASFEVRGAQVKTAARATTRLER